MKQMQAEVSLTLGWEDSLEKGMTTTSVFWPGESHRQRSLVSYNPWGHKESGMTQATEHAFMQCIN